MVGLEILAEFILFARVKDRAVREVEFQERKTRTANTQARRCMHKQ